jgi:hypothetical protein
VSEVERFVLVNACIVRVIFSYMIVLGEAHAPPKCRPTGWRGSLGRGMRWRMSPGRWRNVIRVVIRRQRVFLVRIIFSLCVTECSIGFAAVIIWGDWKAADVAGRKFFDALCAVAWPRGFGVYWEMPP